MEKRRQHERQHADFLGRQNAVGQNDYLNVSPFTDHRILTNYIDQTGELPSRSTHEEFMNVRVMPMSLRESSRPTFCKSLLVGVSFIPLLKLLCTCMLTCCALPLD